MASYVVGQIDPIMACYTVGQIDPIITQLTSSSNGSCNPWTPMNCTPHLSQREINAILSQKFYDVHPTESMSDEDLAEMYDAWLEEGLHNVQSVTIQFGNWLRWLLVGDYDGQRSRAFQERCLNVLRECHNVLMETLEHSPEL